MGIIKRVSYICAAMVVVSLASVLVPRGCHPRTQSGDGRRVPGNSSARWSIRSLEVSPDEVWAAAILRRLSSGETRLAVIDLLKGETWLPANPAPRSRLDAVEGWDAQRRGFIIRSKNSGPADTRWTHAVAVPDRRRLRLPGLPRVGRSGFSFQGWNKIKTYSPTGWLLQAEFKSADGRTELEVCKYDVREGRSESLQPGAVLAVTPARCPDHQAVVIQFEEGAPGYLFLVTIENWAAVPFGPTVRPGELVITALGLGRCAVAVRRPGRVGPLETTIREYSTHAPCERPRRFTIPDAVLWMRYENARRYVLVGGMSGLWRLAPGDEHVVLLTRFRKGEGPYWYPTLLHGTKTEFLAVRHDAIFRVTLDGAPPRQVWRFSGTD